MVLAASSLTDNLETDEQESVQCEEDASICADIPGPE